MRRRRAEAGFSLIEALAALAIVTVVLGAALTLTFQSQASSSDRQGEGAVRQLSRVALSRIIGESRLAGYGAGTLDPIQAAEPHRFQFVADIDDGSPDLPCANETRILHRPERVTFEVLEDGTLRRGIECRNAGNTAWAGGVEWTTVAEGLDTATALFRYFDEDGNELGTGVSALTSSQREDVRSLTVGFDLSLDDTERILGEEPTIAFAGQERFILRNVVLQNQ